MKRLLTLLAFVAMSITTFAYDAYVGGLYYNLKSTTKEATVTYKKSGTGSYSGSIIVPEKVTYNGVEYNVTTIGADAFSRCSGLTSVTIPNSVTSIEIYAFYNTPSLESVILGNSVTSIGSSAFTSCSSLTSVTIPNSVTSIGSYAFNDCTSLTSVTIPNSVTSIGSSAFRGCSNVKELIYADGCTTALNTGLTKIEKIVIPNSVTSIADYAFSQCYDIKDVIVGWKTPLEISSNVFSYIDATLHVPAGTKEAYMNADVWKKFKIVDDAKFIITITLGASDYSTYCATADLDFSEVEGLKAYIASGFNPTTGELTITRMDNIPAREGFLLKGTAGESYEVPVASNTNVVANLMKGTTSALTLSPTDGDCTNYVLTKNSAGEMGFYRFSGPVSVPANKAWLQIPTSAVKNVKGFRIVEEDGEVTGITNVEKNAANSNALYDLQGRRISNASARGIYIQNGKKIMK